MTVAKKKKKTPKDDDTVQSTLGDVVKSESKRTTRKTKSSKPRSKTSKKDETKEKKPKKTKSKKSSSPKKEKSKPKAKKKMESKVSAAGPSLTNLPGIGPKLRERLIDAKYDSVEKISRSRPASISKKVEGLSIAGAKKLVQAAKDLLKEKKFEAKPEVQAELWISSALSPILRLFLNIDRHFSVHRLRICQN